MFCDQLLSLSIMYSKFIHVVACVGTSFLFMAEQYSIVWLYHILFIRSSVNRPLVVFTSSYSAERYYKHSYTGFCMDIVFISLGYIPRRGIAASNDMGMFISIPY